MNRLQAELQMRFDVRLERNRPLAELTSFRIGGPADLFVEVNSEAELSAALAAAHRKGTRAFCLGSGTNLLVSDRGIRGLVIKLGPAFATIARDGNHVSAGGAMQFRALVETVVSSGLKGLEFGEGIPGSVGGGLVMNAGAFSGEIARVVVRVHGVGADGECRALSNAEVGFAYRRTALPPGFVITGVEFELEPGEPAALWARVLELREKRAARQPGDLPNAGSVFKNPPGEFAARLLERAGLKGTRVGAAAFSCMHANFIVNLGGARAGEVRELIDLARAQVKLYSGVMLEPEVRLVGEW
jgi:UDP-N-acetylmuramate dehydrogenase